MAEYREAYLKQCCDCNYVYTAGVEKAPCPRCDSSNTRVVSKFLEVK